VLPRCQTCYDYNRIHAPPGVMKSAALFVSVASLLVAFAGCAGKSPVDPLPALILSRTLMTLQPGEAADIDIAARDSKLNVLENTVASASECFTVEKTGKGVKVTARERECADAFTVSLPTVGLSRTVEIKVMDPLVMDLGGGLLIRYVNSFSRQWNDAGSGADRDFSFWHPIVPEGYHALGSMVRASHSITSSAWMIVVKDSKESGALAVPERYELIWDDEGSGANADGSAWKPVCPAGYVALGVVAKGGRAAPNTEDFQMRCVKRSYAVMGSIGDWIVSDKGSGASMDMNAWKVEPPTELHANDGRVPLPVGTTLVCSAVHQNKHCPNQMSPVHVLMAPLQVTGRADNANAEPRLTGYEPLDTSIPRYFSSVRVPFTLIPAAMERDISFNVRSSPFYNVYRVESYTTLRDGVVDNRQGSNPVTKEFEVKTGLSSTETEAFSKKVGIKVSGEGSAGFLGSGGKWSVEVTTEFGWESSRSSTYSEESTSRTSFTIPAGAYAQIVQVTTRFRAVDAVGQAMDAQIGGSSSIVKYLQYPLPT
jgi:hypothetical protein